VTIQCRFIIVVLSMLLAACSGSRYYPLIDERSTLARESQKLPRQVAPILGQLDTSTATSNSVNEVSTSHQADHQVTEVKPLETDVVATVTLELATDDNPQGPDRTAAPVLPAQTSNQQAVDQLLQQADVLQGRGKDKEAIIRVQRAMRIVPRDPRVYARLAALQLGQGQVESAEQVALKGLGMAAGQADYQYFFLKLVAACRRLQGDLAGEQQAIRQAQKYK
jgi:Flp pilus assembly protein TadD